MIGFNKYLNMIFVDKLQSILLMTPQLAESQLGLQKNKDMLVGNILQKKQPYYPFQVNHPDYYFNYMYPYHKPPYLPYYPQPYQHFNYFDPLAPLLQDKDHQTHAAHPKDIKINPAQKEYIKIQVSEESILKVEQDEEAIRLNQEKAHKQTLFIAARTKRNQLTPTCLLSRFSLVLDLLIAEVEDEQEFQKLYRKQFSKQIKQNQTFFYQLMDALTNRIRSYKKTKEELIKFIIRRTYQLLKARKNLNGFKPQYERLETFHQKNLVTFKSMNIQFLKKQFSNQLFVELYKDFIDNFDEHSQKQNKEKVERLGQTLLCCWVDKSIQLLRRERKLPWVNSNIEKIKRMAITLLKEYEGSSLKEQQANYEPTKK